MMERAVGKLKTTSPHLIGSRSGQVKIIGPAEGWDEHERFPGDLMAANWAIKLVKPDMWVSRHCDMFQKVDSDCLKIHGDTWTAPGTYQIQIPNVWFTGVYAMRLAKMLGYEDIKIFGMPADYSIPPAAGLSNVQPDESQRLGWEQHRDHFEGVKAYGGNLPIWFPELRD